MTKRTKKTDNQIGPNPRGIDPRLVELVRFMARCAAENDFEAMLEAAKDKDKYL